MTGSTDALNLMLGHCYTGPQWGFVWGCGGARKTCNVLSFHSYRHDLFAAQIAKACKYGSGSSCPHGQSKGLPVGSDWLGKREAGSSETETFASRDCRCEQMWAVPAFSARIPPHGPRKEKENPHLHHLSASPRRNSYGSPENRFAWDEESQVWGVV